MSIREQGTEQGADLLGSRNVVVDWYAEGLTFCISPLTLSRFEQFARERPKQRVRWARELPNISGTGWQIYAPRRRHRICLLAGRELVTTSSI